jgi:hypothetical protein
MIGRLRIAFTSIYRPCPAFLAKCIDPMRSTAMDIYPRCPSTLQRCREQRANYVVRPSVSLFELTATANRFRAVAKAWN